MPINTSLSLYDFLSHVVIGVVILMLCNISPDTLGSSWMFGGCAYIAGFVFSKLNESAFWTICTRNPEILIYNAKKELQNIKDDSAMHEYYRAYYNFSQRKHFSVITILEAQYSFFYNLSVIALFLCLCLLFTSKYIINFMSTFTNMIPFVKDSLGNYTFILYLEKTNESIDLSFLIILYTFVFIACLMRAIYEISKKKETDILLWTSTICAIISTFSIASLTSISCGAFLLKTNIWVTILTFCMFGCIIILFIDKFHKPQKIFCLYKLCRFLFFTAAIISTIFMAIIAFYKQLNYTMDNTIIFCCLLTCVLIFIAYKIQTKICVLIVEGDYFISLIDEEKDKRHNVPNPPAI